MKIKVTDKSYEEVMAMPSPARSLPSRQWPLMRLVMRLAAIPELRATHFSYVKTGMEKLKKREPALILMNHSSFTDLNITSKVFADRSYHIVCTRDGFVGKKLLMRTLGCIPTDKFVTDLQLIKDMKYCLEKQKSSIIMFPEASYSFDGTETPLPESLGKLIKLLKVPVIMVKTDGAFLRDPLYNGLRKRKVEVSAEEKYLLGPESIAAMTVPEINALLAREFSYDHFRAQYASGRKVTETFRGEGLHRVLFKCPHCLCEGQMEGRDTGITCRACGKHYELGEDGTLSASEGETRFRFVTDWYAWERAEVRKELEAGTYRMEEEVSICILKDLKSLYRVGDGTLIHDNTGFTLSGCHTLLYYRQKPSASYSLYADYYWYEMGDMISIGDTKHQFYCFPKDQAHCIVAKARLAAEEMYRLAKEK